MKLCNIRYNIKKYKKFLPFNSNASWKSSKSFLFDEILHWDLDNVSISDILNEANKSKTIIIIVFIELYLLFIVNNFKNYLWSLKPW